jgi:hypothetical protein
VFLLQVFEFGCVQIARIHLAGGADSIGQSCGLVAAPGACVEYPLARSHSKRRGDDLGAFFVHHELPRVVAG